MNETSEAKQTKKHRLAIGTALGLGLGVALGATNIPPWRLRRLPPLHKGG